MTICHLCRNTKEIKENDFLALGFKGMVCKWWKVVDYGALREKLLGLGERSG